MTTHRSLLMMLGLLATSAALGAFYPQSYLVGNPRNRTSTQLYPVEVVRVDGVRQRENPVAITPGPHWLEIQALPGDSMSVAQATKPRTYVLKIEPCTRYYLAAKKESAVVGKWKLVIDAVETVAACDPAEELRKFPDPSLPAAPKPSAGQR